MEKQENNRKFFYGWSIVGFVLSQLYFLVIILLESKKYAKVDFGSAILPSIIISIIIALLFGWTVILLKKIVKKEGNKTKQLVAVGLIVALIVIIIIFSSVGVLINLVG